MKRLSVVIANYNYAQYVGAAIQSALDLEWDDVEVVVVDDGSTDDSLAVINDFGDQIAVLATENATQRVAANRGFELTSGDVVIFLDADDLLPPDLPSRLAAVWTPEVSKAQLQMQRIDAHGRPYGAVFPTYDPMPSPLEITRWASMTTAYPTPPGSGNAYSRWFLQRLMPVGPDAGAAADSALLALAPFLGAVVSVPGAVVGYRRHGANDSDLLRDPMRFPREVERAQARWRLARRFSPVSLDEEALFRSRELLQLRVAAARVTSEKQRLPGDRRLRMLSDALRSPFQPGPEPWRHRVQVLVWSLATLLAPSALARRLVEHRYQQGR